MVCYLTSSSDLRNHVCLTCAGAPLAKEYKEENLELVTAGCCNLARHIENSSLFGVPVVVGVNQFATDTDAELSAVKQAALAAGEVACPPCCGAEDALHSNPEVLCWCRLGQLLQPAGFCRIVRIGVELDIHRCASFASGHAVVLLFHAARKAGFGALDR